MSFSTQASFADVENVLTAALPDTIVRQHVLVRLYKSAKLAEALAPSAWGLTLLKDGFRLNVGLVEVMVLAGGYLRVNLNSPFGAEPYSQDCFIFTSYGSFYGDQCAFQAPTADYVKWASLIDVPHESFVQEAVFTRSRKLRKGSPHTKSHSSALYQYVTKTGDEWPYRVIYADEETGLPEGKPMTVMVNKYERNPRARQLCLEHFGADCLCCGMNFESTYGTIGFDGVHVHHLVPMHLRGAEYQINPLLDLIPLCPNCHAAIHSRSPPHSVKELKLMLKQKMVISHMDNN